MKKIICFICLSLYCLIPIIQAQQPFVIGALNGQLGNQLFQIATTVSIALDNNAKPIFPDLKNKNEFNIPLNYQHVFYNFDASGPDVPISTVYQEPGFHFVSIPYQSNMVLRGYFQSEKYFKHHKKTILKLFAPSEEIKKYLETHYDHILSHPKAVSVHLRMYMDTWPEFHPFVGWKYISKAMEQFDDDSLFIIFSDQIDVCKKELQKKLKNKNVIFIEEKHPCAAYDLYLMSMCKHHIISNSSFSWWAAYLNQYPDKIVITPSPSRWFGPGMSHCDTKDLLPDEWTILF